MIHSREVRALMGNIYFMWYLLENYATNPAIKNLVDNNELYFVPVVNPDGLRWNQERTEWWWNATQKILASIILPTLP